LPAIYLSGRLLEVSSNGHPREMTIYDKTRLIAYFKRHKGEGDED